MIGTLSTEQSAALVAALENAGVLTGQLYGLDGTKLFLWCGVHARWELTEAGRIVAQLCKDLADVQKNLTAETVKLKWKDLRVATDLALPVFLTAWTIKNDVQMWAQQWFRRGEDAAPESEEG